MTRAARSLNPFSSSRAMIFPALPAPNASGLMIVSVVLPAMRFLVGCAGQAPSVADQVANDVPAGEEADQLALADHGHAVVVLVAHQRSDFGDRLLGRNAHHLPRHD